MEFVWFTAGLKDYSYHEKKERPSREEAVGVLKNARNICLAKMFAYAPVEMKEIKRLVSEAKAETVSEAAGHLQKAKPSLIEEKLRQLVTLQKNETAGYLPSKKKGDPVDFAWSAYLFSLLENAMEIRLPEQNEAKKEVRLAADYNGWVTIKKCDTGKAEDKEVLATLAGVYATLSKKIPEYASTDYTALESFAESVLKNYPERKSFARLPLLLLEADKNLDEAKKFFPQENQGEAIFYLLGKATSRCGFTPFVSIEAINENYPELKIPKPKGNFGKRKA